MTVRGHAAKQNGATAVPLSSDEKPPRFLIILSDTSPQPIRDFTIQLGASESIVQKASSSRDFDRALRKYQPDVVLGCDEAITIAAFEALQKVVEPQRPIRVLLDEVERDDMAIHADLVIPSSALSTLRACLRPTLRLRAQAISLWQQNQGLTDELTEVKLRCEAQDKIVNEVNLLKETIVRNVSHELRTPLLHLKSAVTLLAEDNTNNSLSNYAIEATARVEAIVKNIAQLAASLDIEMSPVIMREVVDQAIRYLRRSWQHKDSVSRVQVDIEEHLPLSQGDRHALVTVLQLLIDNALKFSSGSVLVRVRTVPQGVLVAVEDSGIGIPPEEIGKIFDSFYQVDSSSTRRFGGTGVGLAIVKLILDKHHIQIAVTSEMGQGSSFEFVLPLADLHTDLNH